MLEAALLSGEHRLHGAFVVRGEHFSVRAGRRAEARREHLGEEGCVAAVRLHSTNEVVAAALLHIKLAMDGRGLLGARANVLWCLLRVLRLLQGPIHPSCKLRVGLLVASVGVTVG